MSQIKLRSRLSNRIDLCILRHRSVCDLTTFHSALILFDPTALRQSFHERATARQETTNSTIYHQRWTATKLREVGSDDDVLDQ